MVMKRQNPGCNENECCVLPPDCIEPVACESQGVPICGMFSLDGGAVDGNMPCTNPTGGGDITGDCDSRFSGDFVFNFSICQFAAPGLNPVTGTEGPYVYLEMSSPYGTGCVEEYELPPMGSGTVVIVTTYYEVGVGLYLYFTVASLVYYFDPLSPIATPWYARAKEWKILFPIALDENNCPYVALTPSTVDVVQFCARSSRGIGTEADGLFDIREIPTPIYKPADQMITCEEADASGWMNWACNLDDLDLSYDFWLCEE